MAKLDKKTIKAMQRMYGRCNNSRSVAEAFGISYSIAWFHTSEKTAGFETWKDYSDFLARQRGFESNVDYRKAISGETTPEEARRNREKFAKKRGFESFYEYRNDWAKKKGYKSYSDYQEQLARKRGYKSRKDEDEKRARNLGFESDADYKMDLAIERQQRPENQKMGSLVGERLRKMKKNQKWFARQMGFTKQAASQIIKGIVMPRKSRWDRMCMILQVSRKTLDKLCS